MSRERFFGLQWRLAIICLVVGIASSLITFLAYYLALQVSMEHLNVFTLILIPGFAVSLVGSIFCLILVRKVKLRLWEAGRMAGLISRGDYRARLSIGAEDEVGWLEEQLNSMAGQLEVAIKTLQELAEKNRQLGEEAGRGAALEERTRLARDLHDTVNQQLFVLAMRTAAIKRRLEKTEKQDDSLIEELKFIEDLSRQAHSQTRELILQIRPITLENEGLGAALKDYFQTVTESESLKFVDCIEPAVHPGLNIGEAMFRIAQEALNNIIKHASATTVTVSLVKDENGIEMNIIDDGRGFDPSHKYKPTAVGLSGIQERVRALDGKVKIESAPGEGAKVTVKVFLTADKEDEK